MSPKVTKYSRIYGLLIGSMLVAGCNGDMQLLARCAWTEMTTTPIGTVSTQWAIRHPRNIDLEMELEFLNYSLNNGPRTYGAALFEQLKSREEITALLSEWQTAPKRLASNSATMDPR